MEKTNNGVPAPAYDLQTQPQHGHPQQFTHQDPGQYQQQYPSPQQHPSQQYASQQQYPSQQQVPQVALSQPQSQYQTAIALHSLGESAAPVDCPSCGKRGLTRVEYHSGQTTLGWAALACVCACLGCIPYLINGLKDLYHYCPHCGVLLAKWHRSGRTTVHAHA